MNDPEIVDLDEQTYDLLLAYKDACDAIAFWNESKIKARDQLVATMGDAFIGRYGGRRVVTVVRTRPHRFDQTAFAADHPGLFETYKRQSDADVIRLSLTREVGRR